MSDTAIKVLVVEPHSARRQEICDVLENKSSCKVVGKAKTISAALWVGEKVDHHVLLVASDLLDPSLFGILSAYNSLGLARKMIAYDIPEQPYLLGQFRKLGVSGFVGKSVPGTEFVSSIETVINDGVYLSASLADTVFQDSSISVELKNDFELTHREIEILSMLANGYCNKEIANGFDLSVRTVETHRLNIRRKTSANSLSDLVKVARDLGIIHLANTLEISDTQKVPVVEVVS